MSPRTVVSVKAITHVTAHTRTSDRPTGFPRQLHRRTRRIDRKTSRNSKLAAGAVYRWLMKISGSVPTMNPASTIRIRVPRGSYRITPGIVTTRIANTRYRNAVGK